MQVCTGDGAKTTKAVQWYFGVKVLGHSLQFTRPPNLPPIHFISHPTTPSLASEWAGTPGRLIRQRYRTASEMGKVRGKFACFMINDIDAGLGRHENTQVRVMAWGRGGGGG